MGSGTKQKTTTRKKSSKKIRQGLEQMSSRQANVIKMRHGLSEKLSAAVGDPPAGCDAETVRRVRSVEKLVLNRARGIEPDEPKKSIKDKIIKTLKRKS
jgi:DNA-directed RNA polymerase sigma subunit (sigma70/sigma32)